MIIEKTELLRDEKKELDRLIEKYRTAGEREKPECFNELTAYQDELKLKKYGRYILSFEGRKEDVLGDIKEILDAVEKKDFEREQDKRRKILSGNRKEKLDDVVEKILRKNFLNFMVFLIRITAAQSAVIKSGPDRMLVPGLNEEENADNAQYTLSDSDQKLFDRYVDMLMEKATGCYKLPNDFSASGLFSSLSVRPYGSIILQNKAINAFSHISDRSFHSADALSEKATAFQEDVEITIDDIADSRFNVSTQKVKDLMLEHLAEQLPRGLDVSPDSIAAKREVTLTVKEVSERFHTGMKEARQMLNEAVTTLYNSSVRWKELSYYTEDGKRRREPEVMEYEHRYLAGIGKTSENTPVIRGRAKVVFDYDFAVLLSRSGYVMFYHPNLYRINSNVNRHSYYLGRKMCEHYNSIVRDYEAEEASSGGHVMAKNANRLSVKNLLKVCPDLPDYEEVMASGGAVRRRIIDPFEKDMYALVEKYGILKTWRYCNKKGKPLSDEQWKELNYQDWSELYIEFEIADYPDQTKRLERQARKMERKDGK